MYDIYSKRVSHKSLLNAEMSLLNNAVPCYYKIYILTRYV